MAYVLLIDLVIATYFYAGKAIPIAGLPTPKVFVTADSVTRGKPFPDPYLLGASGCNASPFECQSLYMSFCEI